VLQELNYQRLKQFGYHSVARSIRRRMSKRLKNPWQMQSVIDNLGSPMSKEQKKLELRPTDGLRKVHKLQLFVYLIGITVMRLDLRRLPIPLLRMH
jgi:hypothetical protein